jgi:hypothetical protein
MQSPARKRGESRHGKLFAVAIAAFGRGGWSRSSRDGEIRQ